MAAVATGPCTVVSALAGLRSYHADHAEVHGCYLDLSRAQLDWIPDSKLYRQDIGRLDDVRRVDFQPELPLPPQVADFLVNSITSCVLNILMSPHPQGSRALLRPLSSLSLFSESGQPFCTLSLRVCVCVCVCVCVFVCVCVCARARAL